MYQKVLVPLDGSKLAECVLPHVEAIAQGCQAKKVVFVRVAEPLQVLVTGADFQLSAEEWNRLEAEQKADADNYIKQVVNKLKYNAVVVQGEVLTGGRAADMIADYVQKNGCDLIVIATHGRSGVGRWMWGSVADRILRSVCVPILMVRAPGCAAGI
ncbi:MAG: UspA domain protein [Dehalococcoidia bacterium]|nr:UspA domain protein [Dehalococcoidia bacterium]